MQDLVWRDEGSGGEVEGCRIWCGGMRDLVVRWRDEGSSGERWRDEGSGVEG